jgi:hypothetical protein
VIAEHQGGADEHEDGDGDDQDGAGHGSSLGMSMFSHNVYGWMEFPRCSLEHPLALHLQVEGQMGR